ncbi:MAG TPA: outer membrane protein assembly factor BamD [Acidobacteriaceae bacterium]|jgi:outer membrane protein assembly factor BamD|nr:outer membrane protein assembly factor BamD [Acidobacteriaceae bacterium]
MNRLVFRVSVVCLGAAVAFSPCAFAKKQKKHKQVNLAANPLANVKSDQPDKILFDKAMLAMKKGKFDVARLDLQTLLNTYPDSEYDMRAKLAVGDTWFKEGGSAALTQAESEYKDFITFFPNSPEAAEAQMKVGDIYFQQMEKPDRDPQNAVHAEQEYRTMLEQFPDSPLIPRAKQRLREVQEVLAQRQFEIGEFYAGREQWPAAIARLETVADSYPLFSKSDQTLITIGDAYATEAQLTQRARLPAKAKAELAKYYDDRAADAWDRVVTRYPLAPHVEDAKDRLIAMGRPVPDPSAQALAESQAEEDSRVNIRLGSRAMQLLGRGPNTVRAARVGDPSLNSPPAVMAPEVEKQSGEAFRAAIEGKPIPQAVGAPAPTPTQNTAIDNGTAPPTSEHPAQGLRLEDVPDASGSPGSTVTVQIPNNGAPAEANPSGATSGGVGINPNATTNASPLVAPLGKPNNEVLPAVDKPAEAPDQINQIQSGTASAAQVNTGANASGKPGKKKKAPFDKKEESSSKHKKKTGADKLNPF